METIALLTQYESMPPGRQSVIILARLHGVNIATVYSRLNAERAERLNRLQTYEENGIMVKQYRPWHADGLPYQATVR